MVVAQRLSRIALVSRRPRRGFNRTGTSAWRRCITWGRRGLRRRFGCWGRRWLWSRRLPPAVLPDHPVPNVPREPGAERITVLLSICQLRKIGDGVGLLRSVRSLERHDSGVVVHPPVPVRVVADLVPD